MAQYFNIREIFLALQQLIPYLRVTFCIVGISAALGMLLGVLIAMGKLSRYTALRGVASCYISIMRCTPSLVLLFLTYYGIPAAFKLVGVNLDGVDKSVFIIISFSLQFAAAMAEVIRTAYESVNRGQLEAAVSVGLTPWEAYRRIVIPQAVVVAIPNLGNSLLALLKEGSLAYTIGLIDVMGKTNLIIAANYQAHALETYIAVSLIYWSLSLIIEWIFRKTELLCGKGRHIRKAV